MRYLIFYLIFLQVQAPEVHGETEWLPVMFHGQSFMLHQVRMEFASP